MSGNAKKVNVLNEGTVKKSGVNPRPLIAKPVIKPGAQKPNSSSKK
jgi:hypothetical protein